MKITVFTSNQPRHLKLVSKLASVSDSVFAVLECNTVFPGYVDDFFKKSEVMQRYLSHVVTAEKEIFGSLNFLPANVATLSLKMGDLSLLCREPLRAALVSDLFIVFGASFIRGWLADELVARPAVNIHMGLSPYYRGSSCNFWALYDGRPAYVGATLHHLSTGLDSGPIIAHVRPEYSGESPFGFAMKSVKVAQDRLVAEIESGSLLSLPPIPQNRGLELRYSRNSDFDDRVAGEFLARLLSPEELSELLVSGAGPTDLL